MLRTVRTGLFLAAICAALSLHHSVRAQPALRCGPFTTEAVAPPAPRGANAARQRFEVISQGIATQKYRVLFLGDSLTQHFDPQVWREHMAPRGVFNAGVGGDRTEHLLWRLQHGHLGGPRPAAIVMLIGTNDLTNGGNPRSPALTAEGIRANLLYLRRHLPEVPILLLGLLPRSASPEAALRRSTVAVNRLIRGCGDDRMVVYAEIGGVLLDREGRLTREIAPDQLHFSRLGYERLAPLLDTLIDRIVAR